MTKATVIACGFLTILNLAGFVTHWSMAARAQDTKLSNDPFENEIFRAEVASYVATFIETNCYVAGRNIHCDVTR